MSSGFLVTFLDMVTEVGKRLPSGANSSIYTLTRKQEAVKESYDWALSLFEWPDINDAKTTSTIANHDYYDYPETLQPESITRIEIDGLPYEMKDYQDFLDFRQNNPTSTKRIFASSGVRYFIFPTPTANGSNNMDLWGLYNPVPLSADGDTTIFSNRYPMGNSAIVKEAVSILRGKPNKNGAMVEDAEAKAILMGIFNKISKRKQKFQRLDHPFFNVPDFFANGSSSPIGNFTKTSN